VSENNVLALPPRREIFTDPGARIVWPAILTLPVAAQHQILGELRDRLACLEGTSTYETRVRHAITSLREVADLLEHSPSVEQYRLARANNARRGWPPDGNVRRWLGGSWNDCLREARLDSVAGGDVIVSQNGPAFSADEVIAALRDCARDLGDIPTLSAYYAWARRPDVKARPGRRPSSQSPFDRNFGSYYKALVAAGLVDGSATLPAQRSSLVRLASYHVSHEQIFAALREVAGSLGRSPRVRDYNEYREKLIRESSAAGHPRSLPSHSKIQKEFSVWDAALKAADLKPLGGRATRSYKGDRGRKGPMLPDEYVFSVLREAYEELGNPFTVAAYKAWRITQRERDRAARVFRRLPDYDVIHSRFGTWGEGVRRALAAEPKATAEPRNEAEPRVNAQPAAAEAALLTSRCIEEFDGGWPEDITSAPRLAEIVGDAGDFDEVDWLEAAETFLAKRMSETGASQVHALLPEVVTAEACGEAVVLKGGGPRSNSIQPAPWLPQGASRAGAFPSPCSTTPTSERTTRC